jgi:phage terminase large subunit-like protein
MNGGMMALERLVMGKLIAHGNNPVLAWNVHNVVVYKDTNGNIKADRRKSTEKIDGAVALAMAIGRANLSDPNAGRSVYEDRDVREL